MCISYSLLSFHHHYHITIVVLIIAIQSLSSSPLRECYIYVLYSSLIIITTIIMYRHRYHHCRFNRYVHHHYLSKCTYRIFINSRCFSLTVILFVKCKKHTITLCSRDMTFCCICVTSQRAYTQTCLLVLII